MSTLIVDELESPTGAISLAPGASIQGVTSSALVQVRYFRTDTRTTYSSTAEMTATRLYITPTSASNILVMEWMVNGEIGHDGVFVIFKNGAVVTEAGYEGYNSNAAVGTANGYAPFYYDSANDNSSTPQCWHIQYTIPAGSTDEQYFSLSAYAQTFYLNRTVSQIGTTSYENGVTTGMIMEWKP